MTRIFSDPRPRLFKGDALTVNGAGKLYFYEPGEGSTTLKSVYADKELTTPLTNPVILGASGRAPTIWLDGDYHVKMTDSADVTIWDIPNYEPADLSAQFSDFDATITYTIYDYVRGSDGNYYQSIVSGNVGNDPTADTTNWKRAFVGQFDDWISTYVYAVDDFVLGLDGNYYQSLTTSNLGNNPTSSATNWVQVYFIDVWNTNKPYAADDIVKYGGDIWVSLQGSNTGNTPAVSSTYWRSFFLPSTASGFTASSFEYRASGSSIFALGSLDVATNITRDTWETVGPTGSGADYIWTTLDDLPSGTKSVILKCKANGSGTATYVDLELSLRQGGSTSSEGTHARVLWAQSYATSGDNAVACVTEQTVVLGTGNIFEVNWDDTGTGGRNINLYLVGVKV
jgi:hypothetical protein